ncbi:prephenate dehydrogenase [Corynebacterium sp. CCM 8835]|uniref:Prephenate dehydrogenase n=1 Tax=Corynebacterium antarcticum TaxID=2800405 RepID=A0ABS1FL56_9CORY|nr:prephenate dehydrogenase [Corynebacterium antarcticum]MCL0245507.1 prephenate dehydrogenase [Corynebacterium antarcticum]MCX7540078.1 prephenate dehydrogenase [Corynebacterium antarcticum]
MTTTAISRPVCVLGLGLIGGSLLRDLAASGHPVFGYNRSPSAAQAAADDGYDVTDSLTDVLEKAQECGALIVMATPMPAIPTLLEAIDNHAPDCGFTDVVSVKAKVLELVRERGMADRYVGGHPMAGTADSGWTASQRDLFRGAAWVVTFDRALDDTPPPEQWVSLWIDVVHMATRVGAEVIPAQVGNHDAAVARISHLPHLLAESLAIVGDNGGALALSLAAGSFRDGTRVAGSAPSLVRAMCETNNEALLDALDETLALLNDARANLTDKRPSIEELVDSGYRSRIRYEARSGMHTDNGGLLASPRPVIRFQPGTPGWINQLAHAEMLGARIEVY